MAGSIKYFVYTDDNGSDWALRRDESNVEALNGGTQDYSGSTPASVRYELPRNVKPRYVRYVSADGKIARNVVALTPTIYSGASTNAPTIQASVDLATDASGSVTLYYKERVGERLRLPIAIDTGLTDGDNT